MKKVPTSVYRLQLNEEFPLKAATKLLPYLKKMGIEGVYCSPYFSAYSSHGYDITNPNKINALIATPKEYETFCKALKKHGLAHIVDVVPNHMGIKGDNPWWQDVLEKGKESKYASFFDINWDKGPILIPILGDGKIHIVRKKNALWAHYADQYFPLNKTQKQHYRLVNWKHSAQETSYRRFFNINELIGIRIEHENVLKAHHKWVLELLKNHTVQGLRIDHPDGLYDPKTYFDRLRKHHQGLIVVEKILGWQEELPPNWDVDGTVGYEFANMLTGIYVRKEEKLTDVYFSFIGKTLDFEQMLYQKKKFYMSTEMAGDVKNLAKMLYPLSSLPQEDILYALYELLAFFPVYRSYIRPKGGVPKRDAPYIKETFQKARAVTPNLKHAFDFLEDIFFLKTDTPAFRDFLMRFQQLSAPIMAKGFEDITLYNYNRLLALNEVGSEPKRHGVALDEFHHFCKRKQHKWPYGFLTTSTHDTKRSHDVRMQLCVLSEIPEKWGKALQQWSKLNKKHKTRINQTLFPEPNAEYFLYQILLGAWPSRPSFTRMWGSFQKSLREARAYTSWREPNEDYEAAAYAFLKAIMKKNNPFLKSFNIFHKEITLFGQYNSLSSTALKLGCPGIVDVYEGCENWRYTLVDPDNRTPVDYTKPETIKTALHTVALNFRKTHPSLFLEGDYIPLKVQGSQKEHVIAFLRTHKNQVCLVAGARFFTSLKKWGDTTLLLPKDFGKGIEIFSENPIKGKYLLVSKLFQNAPFSWTFWK